MLVEPLNDSAACPKTVRIEVCDADGGAAVSRDVHEDRDPPITDLDFGRSPQNVNNEISHTANSNEPIPFDMIRWRAILKQARMKRGHV